MAQNPRTVAQVVAVRVRAGVRAGHGGDDGGLHHPLQVLAGGDCIDGGDEGTVGARHVDPVLLQQNGAKRGQKMQLNGGYRTFLITAGQSKCIIPAACSPQLKPGVMTAGRHGRAEDGAVDGAVSPPVDQAELSLLSTSHFTRITWRTPSHWFGQVLFTLTC